MRNRVNTYLAIALTTHCNYKCFYCKEGGESMSKQKQTIPFEKVKKKIACIIKMVIVEKEYLVYFYHQT